MIAAIASELCKKTKKKDERNVSYVLEFMLTLAKMQKKNQYFDVKKFKICILTPNDIQFRTWPCFFMSTMRSPIRLGKCPV